jgi:hypothetical protein
MNANEMRTHGVFVLGGRIALHDCLQIAPREEKMTSFALGTCSNRRGAVVAGGIVGETPQGKKRVPRTSRLSPPPPIRIRQRRIIASPRGNGR